MNRAPALSFLLIGGLVCVVGCSVSRPTNLPGGGSVPATTSPQAAALESNGSPAMSSSSEDIAPANYQRAATPVMPVAHGAGMAGGHCLACQGGAGSQCAPQSPYGYAAQPAIYNLYGFDPQEFLCDGGDHPPDAAVLRDGSIGGLQPEDTVVKYTTEGGDIELQESNRVCIYAPRFSAVRRITGAISGQKAIGAVGVERPVGPVRVNLNQPGLVLAEATGPIRSSNAKRIDAMRERNRGVPVERVLQLEQAGDVLAAVAGIGILELERLQREELALVQRAATAAVTWTQDLSVEVAVMGIKPPVLTRNQAVEGVTVYDFPDEGRLRIAKFADRQHAQPGDIVSFMIRVENVGDSAVDRVVLTDNLTTRLEYVEGSEATDVEAKFDPVVNEGESLRLQWNFQEPLEVGESATIRFQCRVR